jgi:hypothetical protein
MTFMSVPEALVEIANQLERTNDYLAILCDALVLVTKMINREENDDA